MPNKNSKVLYCFHLHILTSQSPPLHYTILYYLNHLYSILSTFFSFICVYFFKSRWSSPTVELFRCTQGFYSGYPPLYSNKNMEIWNDCFIGIFILYIVLHCPISYYILRLFFFLTLKSTISAIPPLFISLILNSFRSSKSNITFCGTGAAVVVSTARMVISTNDMSVTWYNFSTTLIYLICVILSVIIITSVSTTSPYLVSLYDF